MSVEQSVSNRQPGTSAGKNSLQNTRILADWLTLAGKTGEIPTVSGCKTAVVFLYSEYSAKSGCP